MSFETKAQSTIKTHGGRDFAVRHGRTFTTFAHAWDAWLYQHAVMGGVLMQRTDGGRWIRAEVN